MRARSLLATAAAAVTLLAGVLPATAHDDSEAEAEVGALEVKARPAVAQVDTPVHVRAEYDPDDDDTEVDEVESEDDEAEEESTDDDADEVEDESDDDDADDDESVDDDESEDDDVEAAGAKRDDDAECEDEDESDEDESDDDEADDDEDELDDEAEDDDVEAASVEDECDDADDAAEDEAAPTIVTFTVDFGDGSEPEAMDVQAEKRRGHGNDKTKAAATHRYEAEGDYEVTVTSTPEGGEPVQATVVVSVGRGSARLEGPDRVETALRISRDSFDDGSAGAVLLARADGFADALASATLALAERAPVLLVPSGELPDAVVTEIDRVLGDTGRVYLLGGEAAIGPEVAAELEGLGFEVVRVAGEDRVATSVAIAEFLVDAGVDITEVVLASATTFPDALSGAAYAADRGAPVLLTAPDALSPAVHDLLMSLGTDTAVTVVGGTAGVSDAVVDELTGMGFTVERLAGDDRFETSVEIAEAGDDAPTAVVIATGETFPDALAGGAYAGRQGAPLLLVGDELPDGVEQYLRDNAGTIDVLLVLGGGGAVPQSVMDEIEAALGL